MYAFNKLVGYLLSPFTLGAAVAILSVCLLAFTQRRKWGLCLAFLSCAWLYVWSIPFTRNVLGLSLEREWRVVKAEEMPCADIIVLLGGGIESPTNPTYPYADLKAGADRAWYAAKLWKAGKASVVLTSDKGAEKCDNQLLMDLGVPATNIVLECEATTTEENALFVAALLKKGGHRSKPKALLVTSAYHMRRSVLMFKKYAPNIEVIPAPCDFETTAGIRPEAVFEWTDFVPSTEMCPQTYAFFKEYLGYFGYKYFRR